MSLCSQAFLRQHGIPATELNGGAQAADDSALHAAGMGRMGGRPGGIGGMYVGPDDPIFSGRFPGGGMGGEPPLRLQHSVCLSAHMHGTGRSSAADTQL